MLATATAAGAQPLTFQELLVDGSASGDCKDAADIDGDGDADGIVGGADLRWYRSNGAARTFGGPFLIRTDAQTQQFTTDIAVADMDGDGDVDIVGADEGGAQNVLWVENPRIDPPVAGTDPTVGANWLLHVVGTHGSWAHDIEVGRIDADTLPDIVTLGNGFFKIHFANATAPFWTTVDFGQHADDGSPAIADIDGDDDQDLFVKEGWIESPQSGRRVASNWTFHEITDSFPGDGPAIAAVDIDRDGRVDLVTSPQHNESGALAWFRNPANPEQANWARTVVAASAGSHHLRAADFDGDARPDLLVGLELSAGYIRIYRNTGSTPAFTMHPVASGGGGHNAAVGDLDGNGLPDVWAADWIGNPPLRAYFNAPNLIFRDGFESGNTALWSGTQP